MKAKSVFIGRQPVLDRSLQVFGYELLFRDSAQDAQAAHLDELALQKMANAFIDVGFDRLVGEHRAIIHFSPHMMKGVYLSLFPKDRVVLKVLKNVDMDPQMLMTLSEKLGGRYAVAVDQETSPALDGEPHIIKIDVKDMDRGALKAQVDRLRRHTIRLLAEKVETHDDFAFCKELGFHYFQGQFFCKPKLIAGDRVPANRLTAMRLLAKVQDPKVDMRSLESLICQDVTLSYKLLRYINSAFFGLGRKVESIQHSLSMLGTQNICNWVSLLALSRIEDQPPELIVTAMIRAKMCESLGRALKVNKPEIFFTVGLFSTLDALMNCPLETLLPELPLSDSVTAALLQHKGVIGKVLGYVLDYEIGAWDKIQSALLSDEAFLNSYLDAITWARQSADALVKV